MTKVIWFSWFYAIFYNQIAKHGFYSAPYTGIFSRFNCLFPCKFYIRISCDITNIPLDKEHCRSCSLLYTLMAASTRFTKTGKNLPFSSKKADICLQIKCREQRDYPPWLEWSGYSNVMCIFAYSMSSSLLIKNTAYNRFCCIDVKYYILSIHSKIVLDLTQNGYFLICEWCTHSSQIVCFIAHVCAISWLINKAIAFSLI